MESLVELEQSAKKELSKYNIDDYYEDNCLIDKILLGLMNTNSRKELVTLLNGIISKFREIIKNNSQYEININGLKYRKERINEKIENIEKEILKIETSEKENIKKIEELESELKLIEELPDKEPYNGQRKELQRLISSNKIYIESIPKNIKVNTESKINEEKEIEKINLEIISLDEKKNIIIDIDSEEAAFNRIEEMLVLSTKEYIPKDSKEDYYDILTILFPVEIVFLTEDWINTLVSLLDENISNINTSTVFSWTYGNKDSIKLASIENTENLEIKTRHLYSILLAFKTCLKTPIFYLLDDGCILLRISYKVMAFIYIRRNESNFKDAKIGFIKSEQGMTLQYKLYGSAYDITLPIGLFIKNKDFICEVYFEVSDIIR